MIGRKVFTEESTRYWEREEQYPKLSELILKHINSWQYEHPECKIINIQWDSGVPLWVTAIVNYEESYKRREYSSSSFNEAGHVSGGG